jgi:hypothetical protein
LDANIPYIDIRDGNGREVKTRNAVRKIPLVGVALKAMRRHPNGFLDFRNRIKDVRDMINGHLRSLQPDVNEEGDVTRRCTVCATRSKTACGRPQPATK